MIGLTVFPTIADTIFISVVAQNHFPYKGFCFVSSNGPFPVYYKHSIDDDTIGTSYGNNDGLPNPGEKIELPLMLKNQGNEDATDVSGYLSSQDNLITITDSLELFGNISAGDSAISQDDYDFTISPSAADKHSIFFEIEVHDTNDSIWISHFELTVHSPILQFVNFTVNDSGQSNQNGILDPGETVELICRLRNIGSGEAYEVNASLLSENTYIECIDTLSYYGNILPDNEKEGTPFTIRADSLTPIGYDAEMKLIFSTKEGYKDSIEFCIKVGMGKDFFIWDPDKNHTSGPSIYTALELCGYRGKYSTTISNYLHTLKTFRAIFICLGVYPNNYILKNGEVVDSLCSFLDNGGRIYLEGADTWGFDVPTALHPYFKIRELYDGYNDTYSIYGISGTFTFQMNFTYSGENNFMDRIATTGGSFSIFRNLSPYYINGIAYDAGSYKTVGTSFEFGGLVDGTPPSTKEALADSIMHFFGITGICEQPKEFQHHPVFSLSKNSPNPFYDKTTFYYSIPLRNGENPLIKKDITLKIFDVAGRNIKTLVKEKKKPGSYTVIWDGTNNLGKRVSQGVYFSRLILEKEGLHKTRKIVILR